MTTPPPGTPGDPNGEQSQPDPYSPVDYPAYPPPPSAYPPPPSYPSSYPPPPSGGYPPPPSSGYPPPPAGAYPPPPSGYPASYPPQPSGGYSAPGAYPPAAGGYPAPYPGSANPYDPYGQQRPTGTNTMAIASLATSAGGLVLTLLCCAFIVAPIVGIVLGVVALNQIKTTGQPGRGLAIAGIVVGALTLLLALILVIAVGAVGLNSPDYSSI